MTNDTQPFGEHSHTMELALRDATIDDLRRQLDEARRERDAAVASERERCAKVAELECRYFMPGITVLPDIASIIRSGK